jgi:Co/Zn/Cd efflux system component
MDTVDNDAGFRRIVRLVILLNLSYFGIEFVVASRIGSVSLFADSVDFLEDASLNFLILAALRLSAARRARVGMVLAVILLIPGLATLWTAGMKFHSPSVPNPMSLSVTALGALVINISCAYLLARFRNREGSLSRAAFLSARNDTLANIAMIVVGLVTVYWASPWPDVIVGLGIALMNADAAREVWTTARAEHRVASMG